MLLPSKIFYCYNTTPKLMENNMRLIASYKHLPALILLLFFSDTTSLYASTHNKSNRSDHKAKQSNHSHYLIHHGNANKHIDNRHHHKSPKWHPTNPHTGNFAD